MRRRVLVLLPLVAAIAAAPAPAAVPGSKPPVHRDAAEDPGDPLDLRAAAFGQVGTQLLLRVRTQGEWSPGGGPLCVALARNRPLGQICVVVDAKRHPALRFRRGAAGPLRAVRGAGLERRGTVLRALVYPRALGLDPGGLRWFVTNDEGDRLPDAGALPARVSVYGAPRCFGAAGRACVNKDLRRVVYPKPGAAAIMPDYPCQPVRGHRRYAPAEPCAFGATYADGPPRIALIGDSHSAHLRATVEVAAQALGWKAISITHPGCAFSSEAYPAPAPIPERCRRHSRQAVRWLRGHPSVRVVVTSASAGRGLGEGGFSAMWSQVPRRVRRIYVVRDVPRVNFGTAACVASVRRQHAVSRGACAVPRSGAFPSDPAAGAARHSGRRVRLIDLTRFFCDSSRCYPVMGGAYVYRDFNHLNPVFGATLGPYLLRAMRLRP